MERKTAAQRGRWEERKDREEGRPGGEEEVTVEKWMEGSLAE